MAKLPNGPKSSKRARSSKAQPRPTPRVVADRAAERERLRVETRRLAADWAALYHADPDDYGAQHMDRALRAAVAELDARGKGHADVQAIKRLRELLQGREGDAEDARRFVDAITSHECGRLRAYCTTVPDDWAQREGAPTTRPLGLPEVMTTVSPSGRVLTLASIDTSHCEVAIVEKWRALRKRGLPSLPHSRVDALIRTALEALGCDSKRASDLTR